MTPFYPPIQAQSVLTGVQKYLLRLLLGDAGKTLIHRDRLVEVIEMHDYIWRLYPLMDSDLLESNRKPFWVPKRPSDRKRFNVERRDRSRGGRAATGFVGISSSMSCSDWKRSEPYTLVKVVSAPLQSNFPSPGYLERLQKQLGYPVIAARAAQVSTWVYSNFTEQSDRKRSGEDFSDPFHPYIPGAQPRETLAGGGFGEKRVRDALRKMKTSDEMKTAVFEVVYRRQSPQTVAEQFRTSRAKLDVYASRLRSRIRQAA